MKDGRIFQDDLRTADKIEAARKAREQQINKGICYGTTPSLGMDKLYKAKSSMLTVAVQTYFLQK